MMNYELVTVTNEERRVKIFQLFHFPLSTFKLECLH